ncbi:ankyrin repeat-containing protein [Rickettsia rhipicephali str. 3-7-female6-CWPP]|uniref:Ankyrin repeat-containing protein n=2 Tax=Rickettsia rhipicephali TaxID=33992 RepID=A0AAI8AAN6_RICR3|nr:ankyrin repeat-containing protein [Rickettsia rhipicephali str. 3-7-female6-CWPP]
MWPISRMLDQAINHITHGGDTTLTLAVWNGLERVCELLIPRTTQAIHHVNNNKGATVLNLVIKNNFKNIYDLLTLRVKELNNQFNKTNIYKNEDEKLIIAEKANIYQIIGKIIFNLQNSTNIDEADKPIIENNLYRILNKVQKLTDKNDIINITQSITELIGNEITEGTVVDLEDEVNEMAEKQTQKS